MNKISLYILLVLVFLGLSQSFSMTEKGTVYIKNKEMMGHYFEGSPVCLLLIDSFETGFLIKTYYHKYKIIYGFKQPRIFTVRTSFEFYRENTPNIGMSIFRRGERVNSENTVPMPPGTLFVGNPAYGSWTIIDSGQKVWIFHRAYRHFAHLLGLGDFRPSYQFFKNSRIHLVQERPFYGLSNEFGTNGSVTRANFPEYFHKSQKETISIRTFLKKLIKPRFYGKNS